MLGSQRDIWLPSSFWLSPKTEERLLCFPVCSFHKLTEGFPKAPSGIKSLDWAEWFGTVRGWLVITYAIKKEELKKRLGVFRGERTRSQNHSGTGETTSQLPRHSLLGWG